MRVDVNGLAARWTSMRWLSFCLFIFCLLKPSQLASQQGISWLRGDTTGAPRGCSASAAVAAIGLLMTAMRDGDSLGLQRAVAPKFVFSIIPLVSGEQFFIARSISDLVRYARRRRELHEHMELKAVVFNGWRRNSLHFGPVYFLRLADDPGGSSARGGGKGTYKCGQGISVFNLGPLPPNDPGPPPILRPPA